MDCKRENHIYTDIGDLEDTPRVRDFLSLHKTNDFNRVYNYCIEKMLIYKLSVPHPDIASLKINLQEMDRVYEVIILLLLILHLITLIIIIIIMITVLLLL